MNKKLSANAYQLVDHYIGAIATPNVGEPIAMCGSCEWTGRPDEFYHHRSNALRRQRLALDSIVEIDLT